MKSFEAIQSAIAGKTVEHAKKLHLSTSQLNKWQEPSTDFNDSGSYNPLDRIETIIATSLENGIDHDHALAPIRFLSEKFGLITIPVPDIKNRNIEDISKEFLKTISEFGDLTKEYSFAMSNNEINPREAKKLETETWELIRQAAIFLFKVKNLEKGK